MQKPAVVLTVTQGQLAGATYVFDRPSICVLGRGDSCFPRFPNDEHHKDVSRYHCLLIINPPQLFVQDLGSCNGTFVNGQRLMTDLLTGDGITSMQRIPSGRYPLMDGDVFAVGEGVAFRVSVTEHEGIVVCSEDSATFEKIYDRPVTEDPKCLFSAAKLASA